MKTKIVDASMESSDSCYVCRRSSVGRWRITRKPVVYTNTRNGEQKEVVVRIEADYCQDCLSAYRREGLKREMVLPHKACTNTEDDCHFRYWPV